MKRAVIAFDTEDDSKGHVALINFYDGQDHHSFIGPDLRAQAWSYLRAAAPAYVWACNMEYDLINTFGEWLGKMVTLQYVSAGLMRGSYREAEITFYDTLRHWPASVEAMGKEIGHPKLDAVWDGTMPMDDYPDGRPGIRTYCRRDTEIVHRYVIAMLERYAALDLSIRPTTPAMAMQLFKKSFYRRDFVRLPPDMIDFFRSGYYGGRVEVFKIGITAGPFNCYDVNSLFPSVMASHPFPDLHEWFMVKHLDLEREGMAEVTLEYPYQFIPCLPVRFMITNQDAEIVYPHGRLRGVWPYPEIRQALLDGARIVTVHRAVEFSMTEDPFRDYVHYCYGRRMDAQSPVDKTFWKLMMNSLYGKFGQSNEGVVTIYDDKEIRSEDMRVSEHVNVIWSAYVTSYARLRLLGYLRACSEVYYTDTDSLFTPDELPRGNGLGELKHEAVILEGEFRGNKLYLLTVVDGDGTKEIAKAKGVRKSEAANFLRTGRAVYRRPARFRESRRNFVTANVWYEVEKTANTQYTKRRKRRDGSGWTEPWVINEYTRRVSAIRVRGQK